MMLSHLTDVVLPPLTPAEGSLNFFCDLHVHDAPRVLLASMLTWVRIHDLEPGDISVLIASGVCTDEDWYALASRWMCEAKDALATDEDCLAALDQLRDLLTWMGPVGPDLKAYLKNSFSSQLQ